MLNRHGNWLIGGGVALIALACALLFYDPKAGRIAFYPTAMTGFAIPAGIGAMLAIFGAFVKAGKSWALWASLILLLLTGVNCFMRSQTFRRAAATGEPHKGYASIVVGVMAAVSLVTLVNVARGVAFLPRAGDGNAS